MQNQEITRQLQKLLELIKKAREASGDNVEMQAHWARYVCVLSAGLIENALVEIYREFVHGAASKPVADFATSVLSKIQNPKTQRFLDTAGSFKQLWGEELKDYVETDGRKEAIDSIIANRHLIAHGKNSGVTLVRVKDYLDKAVQVIDFIEGQCRR